MKTITSHIEELDKTAEAIKEYAEKRNIWLFSGEIGAGKTTLIKTICRLNGVEEKVTSPTFSLVNQYQSNTGLIYHLDLYRLEDMEEAIDIGIEDILYGDQLALIEWPQIIAPLLPIEVLQIHIEIIEDSKRKITLL